MLLASKDTFHNQLVAFHIFHHAPTVVFISAEETETYGAVDAANAAQNMAAATWWSLGEIGSCYIASFQVALSRSKRESYLERLNLPDKYAPQFCLALGYHKGDISEATGRKQNTINFIR